MMGKQELTQIGVTFRIGGWRSHSSQPRLCYYPSVLANRLFMLAFVVLNSPFIGQEPTQGPTAIIVIDQIGARIPGAHVSAINRESGARFDSAANSQGEALLQLAPGTYTLKVQARGFRTWEEDRVDASTPIRRTVSLQIGQLPCTLPCDPLFKIEIPVEHSDLTAEIPLLPLQSLEPLEMRSSRHRH